MMVVVFAGCGLKPRPERLPSDVTIETVIGAIQIQSKSVGAFSGIAKVRIREGDAERNATAVVAYKRPEQYKITLLGFAGAEIAEICSQGDSITIYIPYYNGYVRIPGEGNSLGILAPELADIDPRKMVSVIEGASLPYEKIEDYSITLKRWERNAELILEREGIRRCYIVEGSHLLVVEESESYNRNEIRRIVRSDYKMVNDTLFPHRILLRDSRRSLQIHFSGVSINSQLREEELAIQIPDDAGRLIIRNPRP